MMVGVCRSFIPVKDVKMEENLCAGNVKKAATFKGMQSYKWWKICINRGSRVN